MLQGVKGGGGEGVPVSAEGPARPAPSEAMRGPERAQAVMAKAEVVAELPNE